MAALYKPYYCTLDYCKQFMKAAQATGATLSADDQKLLDSISVVSKRVDRTFQNNRSLFEPYLLTRRTLLTASKVNTLDNTLLFDGGSLLELTAVSVNGTALTVGGNVLAYPDASMPPFRELFLNDCVLSWYSFCLTNFRQQFYVDITGYWGFHTDYANAFQSVDTLAAAITTTTATTLTVADADGADAYGMTPRFSAGHLLKIDSELLRVTNVNSATDTLTVVRGVNGTTAATHLISAPVSTWSVEEPVQRAVARQAALVYSRIGAYNTVEVQGMTEIRFPIDFLTEVWQMMGGYAYS